MQGHERCRSREAVVGALAAAVATLVVLACGGHAPVEVRVPQIANPTRPGTPALRIGKVEDRRRFVRRTGDGYEHSLQAGDPSDFAYTERVVGRSQAAGGPYLGEVLLTEGRSVAQLVAEAVALGFREADYAVLVPGDDGYDQAAPVDLHIRRFWVRMDTHRPAAVWDLKSEVYVRAPVAPFQEGGWVCGNAFVSAGGPGPGIWTTIVEKGLLALAGRLKATLAARSLGAFC